MTHARGEVAVIFVSRRVGDDGVDYAAASAAMDAAAAAQPGYLGIDSARNADGSGITVSWWASEAAAAAWRAHAGHLDTQRQGRDRWYESYEVAVAEVVRSYGWSRQP